LGRTNGARWTLVDHNILRTASTETLEAHRGLQRTNKGSSFD
jgi:hypothetical protein